MGAIQRPLVHITTTAHFSSLYPNYFLTIGTAQGGASPHTQRGADDTISATAHTARYRDQSRHLSLAPTRGPRRRAHRLNARTRTHTRSQARARTPNFWHGRDTPREGRNGGKRGRHDEMPREAHSQPQPAWAGAVPGLGSAWRYTEREGTRRGAVRCGTARLRHGTTDLEPRLRQQQPQRPGQGCFQSMTGASGGGEGRAGEVPEGRKGEEGGGKGRLPGRTHTHSPLAGYAHERPQRPCSLTTRPATFIDGVAARRGAPPCHSPRRDGGRRPRDPLSVFPGNSHRFHRCERGVRGVRVHRHGSARG